MGGFSKERLDRMRGIMAGYVERGDLPGLVMLLSRHGQTRVEAIGRLDYDGGTEMKRDTIFRIASLTKPITAVAAMILVEECRLRLDDPLDDLLPELSDRRVLKRLDGPLDDTAPAPRSITLRDLLTMRMGLGHIMQPGEYPILRAANDRGILTGPPHPASLPDPDEWMRRLGELPLMFAPGEKWQYDVAMDVLGVLVGRAAGQSFESFLKARVFDPLGMKDTAFYVPEEEIGRLATNYEDGEVYDDNRGGEWSRPPEFAMGSGGLVSTVDDLQAFAQMLKDNGGDLLSRPTVLAMTTDQLTPEQREGNEMFFEGNRSWGFGMAVFTKRDAPWASPGRFGWDGGFGTSAYTDPNEDLIGILLTGQSWTSPTGPAVWNDFWTLAYTAI